MCIGVHSKHVTPNGAASSLEFACIYYAHGNIVRIQLRCGAIAIGDELCYHTRFTYMSVYKGAYSQIQETGVLHGGVFFVGR